LATLTVGAHPFTQTLIRETIGIDIDALCAVSLGLGPLLHLLSPLEPLFPSAGHLVGVVEEHKVHDTQVKRLRHLNFFQHECYLEVRVPRVKLPDGKVALVEPDWVGKLAGFTLLFEALVLMLAHQMPFAAVARTIGESWHRVHPICRRYVDLALAGADLSSLILSQSKANLRQWIGLGLVVPALKGAVIHCAPF
jgi:Helix-turn-helix domain of transposase family ISL3/zinc-finger of transposase IS204/IS1001/IS1096/IS1165